MLNEPCVCSPQCVSQRTLMFLFKAQTFSDIVNKYRFKFNVWILTQSYICCGHVHSGRNHKTLFCVLCFYLYVIWLVQMTDECFIAWVFSIYLLQIRKSFRITMFGCMHSLLYCLYRDWLKIMFVIVLILCINYVKIAVFPQCLIQICLVIGLGEHLKR